MKAVQHEVFKITPIEADELIAELHACLFRLGFIQIEHVNEPKWAKARRLLANLRIAATDAAFTIESLKQDKRKLLDFFELEGNGDEE